MAKAALTIAQERTFAEYLALFAKRTVNSATSGLAYDSTGALKVNLGAGLSLDADGAIAAAVASAVTGTTNNTFTVDSDNATGKLILKVVTGGTNHTVTIQNTTTSQNCVFTLPDVAADTIAVIGASQVMTSKTLTAPVINGASSASGNFDISGSNGTFKSCTGENTLGGNVTVAAGKTFAIGTAVGGGVATALVAYSPTAVNGGIKIAAVDSGAARYATISNEALTQSTTYKLPDLNVAGAQFVCVAADNTVKFTGAFDTTFVIPAAHTYTLPDADCTLASADGSSAGTTSSTYTIDNDSGVGKLVLRTNAVACTNHTVTLQASVTTQNVTLSLPDVASDTIAVIGAAQTFAAKTLTAPVINGCTTAAAANNFTLNTGSGAFTTPTGQFTFYGNVASNGNISVDFSGSNSTFKTSTGTNTIGGNLVTAAGKTISVGTAAGGVANGVEVFSATAGKGSIRLHQPDDANNKITTIQANNAAANAIITLPNATATVATLGLSETLDLKTLTNGGAWAQTGAVAFTTGTGAVSLNGTTIVAAGKALEVGTVAGGGLANAFVVYSPTAGNGGLKVSMVDSGGARYATLSNEALTQSTTYKLPDLNVATSQFVCVNSDHTVNVTAAADAAVTFGTSTVFGGTFVSAGNLDIGDHALTLHTSGATTLTLPTAGTLATLAETEALTNKTLDMGSNTVSNIGPFTFATGVVGLRGGAVPTAAALIAFTAKMDDTAGSVTFTNSSGDTLRIMSIGGRKTNAGGGVGDTVRVFNGGNAITDAKSLNAMADQTVFGFTTENDAFIEIINTGTVVVTTVKGGATDPSCEIVVTMMHV